MRSFSAGWEIFSPVWGVHPVAFFDEFFKLRLVSCGTIRAISNSSATDVGLLGADLQPALLPVKIEICQLAQHMRGDLHRAAMQLLTQRQARRFPMLEQELVVAALRQLQGKQETLADV